MRAKINTRIERTPIFDIFRDLGVEKDRIRMDSNITNDLDYDDLDWLLLQYFIENRMNVQIVERDILNISTIGDLVSLVESRRNNCA